MAVKTMLRVKSTSTPVEDEPKVKRRPGNRFKAIIDKEDYEPELVASYAKKVKYKKGGKVKLKGKIKPGMTILKPGEGESEPIPTTRL